MKATKGCALALCLLLAAALCCAAQIAQPRVPLPAVGLARGSSAALVSPPALCLQGGVAVGMYECRAACMAYAAGRGAGL